MEHLDDVCHIESRFGLFGENVSFGARLVHSLHLMHHSLRNHFGRTYWNSQVKRLEWKLGSVCVETVLSLMQDRCMVCMECIICWEINWTHPMELLDDMCHGISIRSVWRQCQFRCRMGAQFGPNALQSKKTFWTHLLVLQGEEAQVEAQFGLFRDSANLDPRQDMHGTYYMLGNQFGRT